MKKLTIMILILILILPCMTSCGYIKLNYPKDMTNEYCMQNYYYADPNLTFLSCDLNSADGYYNFEGRAFYFRAIKGVPAEKYLVAQNNMIFDKITYYDIVKHCSMGFDNPEILTNEIESIEIYKRQAVSNKDSDMRKLGKTRYDEQIALLTDEQVDALMTKIKTSLDTHDYIEIGAVSNDLVRTGLKIECYCIRVHFSEYKNLVWDSNIVVQDGKYEMVFYCIDPTYSESDKSKENLSAQIYHSPWNGIRIELPEELNDLIPAD